MSTPALDSAAEPPDESLLRAVYDPSTVSGVFLYGSRATGAADELSDFDVICTLAPKHHQPRREVLPLGRVFIDVYYSPVALLHRKLCGHYPNNNNFVLNALCEGRILLDGEGDLARLVVCAKRMQSEGPPALPEAERVLVRQQLKAALGSVERNLVRSQESTELTRLVQLRCGEIFSKMVTTYYVERRQWTTSLPTVLRRARQSSPELFQRAHDYLTAPSTKAGICALYQMLDLLGS